MNYYNILDENEMPNIKELIDIWFTAKPSCIFIKDLDPMLDVLGIDNLTLQTSKINLEQSIKLFSGLDITATNLTKIASQVLYNGKEYIKVTEYIIQIDDIQSNVLNRAVKGSFIDYREIEDKIIRYRHKSNHFYDTYYPLLTYLDKIYINKFKGLL